MSTKVNKNKKDIKPVLLSSDVLKFKDLSLQEQYSFLQKIPKYKHAFYWWSLSNSNKIQLKNYANNLKQSININKANFSSKNVFEIRNYNLWYQNGKKQALYDISLDLKKGEVTSFIGPSGCGKSTLLKCLNRMNDYVDGVITEGDIWFKKVNIKSKKLSSVELTTRVGMVFQKPCPFAMSIYDNVAFGPRNHGIKDKKKIDSIVYKSLKDAALWDEVKDELHTTMGTNLSGGQQQRLCIACTIALEPEVILMDEPTSALDPIATSKVEDLILKLSKKVTIIIVTHSMAQAQRISNNTVFFYRGKVIESGFTRDIFTKPKEKLTKDYINGRIG